MQMAGDRPGFCPVHPGVIVKRNIDALGVTIEAFADHIGTSRQNVHAIIRGDRAVTPEMAARLGRAFGNPLPILAQPADELRCLGTGAPASVLRIRPFKRAIGKQPAVVGSSVAQTQRRPRSSSLALGRRLRLTQPTVVASNPQVPVHQFGAGLEFRGRALEDDLALDQDDDAVGDRRDAATVLSMISVAMPVARIRRMVRQISSRMMGARPSVASSRMSRRGLVMQRAADGQHLLLAARELVAAIGQPLGQARERAPARARTVQRRWPRVPAALGDRQVLRHAEAGEDAAALRHVGDAAPGDRDRSAGRHVLAVEQHLAARAAAPGPSACAISVVLPMPLRPIRPMVSPARDRERDAAQDWLWP